MVGSTVADKCNAGEITESYILMHRKRGGGDRGYGESQTDRQIDRLGLVVLKLKTHHQSHIHFFQQGQTCSTRATPI